MAKRGNGEGSISKRKDGRYMARYTIATPEGPKQKTIMGKKGESRDDVAARLADALSDRNKGLNFDAENLTVAEYLTRWLTDHVKGTVRDSTYDSYGWITENYIIPELRRVKLKNLKPTHLRKLMSEMGERGLSTRTIRYTHTIIKKALKDAVRDDLIPRNVADGVDPPQLRQEEIKPLSAEQVRILLDAAESSGNRLAGMFTLAVHTGMRPGEMLALKWEDVDLEGGTLSVKRSLSNGEFTPPKTGKGRRIQLSQAATEALRSHRKMVLEERMQAGANWQGHGLVFPTSTGTPLEHHNVVRSFKRLLRRAGLPETFRLYDLRHTAATLLLAHNVHPKYVAEMLGHSSIAITLDKYSHVIPGMDGGTASAMDEALG